MLWSWHYANNTLIRAKNTNYARKYDGTNNSSLAYPVTHTATRGGSFTRPHSHIAEQCKAGVLLTSGLSLRRTVSAGLSSSFLAWCYLVHHKNKNTLQLWDQRFRRNSSLQAVCDAPIARIAGCVSSLRIVVVVVVLTLTRIIKSVVTGLSNHSGVEEYPREKHIQTKSGTTRMVYHSWRSSCLRQKNIKTWIGSQPTMCQIHTGPYVSLMVHTSHCSRLKNRLHRLPPRKDYHAHITRGTCHYYCYSIPLGA